ncbi:MAG TPA: hypothetical protein VEG61_08475 [Candidatus Dormibacteraeota bacterium]|nr:hypothetical protein [Candidatus Dormibacteraeota bacterium]
MSEDEFLKESVGIVEKAQSRGVYLRILGSLAAYIRAREAGHEDFFKSLGRFGEGMPLFTDLDLAGYEKQRGPIDKIFHELAFQPDTLMNGMFGHKRLIYYHPERKFHVDIFLNKLEFSHDVKFGEKPGQGRLEIDYPTISPADIVLEKLQIHQINRKDLIDLITLFFVHDVQDQFEKQTIDGAYIGKILAGEWGFWYDARTNLEKVGGLLQALEKEGKLSPSQRQIIEQRMEKLLNCVNNTPKDRNWEKRAKTGTKKAWYREVEEVRR